MPQTCIIAATTYLEGNKLLSIENIKKQDCKNKKMTICSSYTLNLLLTVKSDKIKTVVIFKVSQEDIASFP